MDTYITEHLINDLQKLLARNPRVKPLQEFGKSRMYLLKVAKDLSRTLQLYYYIEMSISVPIKPPKDDVTLYYLIQDTTDQLDTLCKKVFMCEDIQVHTEYNSMHHIMNIKVYMANPISTTNNILYAMGGMRTIKAVYTYIYTRACKLLNTKASPIIVMSTKNNYFSVHGYYPLRNIYVKAALNDSVFLCKLKYASDKLITLKDLEKEFNVCRSINIQSQFKEKNSGKYNKVVALEVPLYSVANVNNPFIQAYNYLNKYF